jgi:hypothetical protein
MTEETHYITPTVIYRAGGGTMEAAVVNVEGARALFLFSSEEEAEEYRRETGTYPHVGGFVNVPLDLVALKDLLALHECTHVVMPRSLTGEAPPDFILADDFVGLLEEGVPA